MHRDILWSTRWETFALTWIQRIRELKLEIVSDYNKDGAYHLLVVVVVDTTVAVSTSLRKWMYLTYARMSVLLCSPVTGWVTLWMCRMRRSVSERADLIITKWNHFTLYAKTALLDTGGFYLQLNTWFLAHISYHKCARIRISPLSNRWWPTCRSREACQWQIHFHSQRMVPWWCPQRILGCSSSSQSCLWCGPERFGCIRMGWKAGSSWTMGWSYKQWRAMFLCIAHC